MTQLLVRNLGESVKAGLRRLAKRHGHSMEEEARNILRAAVAAKTDNKPKKLGTLIAGLFKDVGLRESEEIRELRGQWIHPAKFDD